MNTFKKTNILTLCSIAISLNIVLGIITSNLKLPLYLDALGTIFIAVYFGPFYGATVGALTNIMTGLIFNPKDIPFLFVNVMIGLVVGYIAKKFKFTFFSALITGLLLSILCPLVGTPIGVWLYGGLSGTGLDFLFLWLKESGSNIFVASFVPKIINNLLDKIGCCILIYILINSLPKNLRPSFMQKTEPSKIS